MSLTSIVIEGTLKPDGTLELDEKPKLAPGRVQVTAKPLTALSTKHRGLVEVMDEIRQNQRARGYQGRTVPEMQAEEKARREEDEDYERHCEQLWGGPLPPGQKLGIEHDADLSRHLYYHLSDRRQFGPSCPHARSSASS